MDKETIIEILQDQLEYWKEEAGKDSLILYNQLYYEGAIEAIIHLMDGLGVEHEEHRYFIRDIIGFD